MKEWVRLINDKEWYLILEKADSMLTIDSKYGQHVIPKCFISAWKLA